MEIKVNNLSHTSINIEHLKHLQFKRTIEGYTAILVDSTDFEILKGYGKTITEAINDLHHNLI